MTRAAGCCKRTPDPFVSAPGPGELRHYTCECLRFNCSTAQEMLIYMYICPSGPSLSRAVNFHLSGSESNQRAIREQLESYQSIKIRVIQLEPLNTASLDTLKCLFHHNIII